LINPLLLPHGKGVASVMMSATRKTRALSGPMRPADILSLKAVLVLGSSARQVLILMRAVVAACTCSRRIDASYVSDTQTVNRKSLCYSLKSLPSSCPSLKAAILSAHVLLEWKMWSPFGQPIEESTHSIPAQQVNVPSLHPGVLHRTDRSDDAR
jgi:hypothetical protein